MPIPDKKFADFVKENGFTSTDARAIGVVASVAKRLAFNMINNARTVSIACNCKTIRSSHFKAVDQLMRKIVAQHRRKRTTSSQSGGFAETVLPIEFYHPPPYDASPFLPLAQVQPMETHLFSDPGLARAEHTVSGPALNAQFGGASLPKKVAPILPVSLMEEFVEEYNNRRPKAVEPVKISKAALGIMRIAIFQSIVGLLRHIRASGVAEKGKLSGMIIKEVIKTHEQFAHMRVQRPKSKKKIA